MTQETDSVKCPAAPPLQYAAAPSRQASDHNAIRLAAFFMIIVQFIWLFPSMFYLLDALSGLPHHPLKDFFLYLAVASPSLAVIALGFIPCWTHFRQRKLLHECKLLIAVMLLAALIVGTSIHCWVQDDFVNANVPRGMW